METILSLHEKKKQGFHLKLALESGSNILTTSSSFITANGHDLLCVREGQCCFLYTLVDHKLTLLGTYFFRSSGTNQVLSVAVDECVKDFPELHTVQPAVCSEEEVLQFSVDGDVKFVAFVGDVLLIGSNAGYLGILSVSSDRCSVKGKTTRVQERSGVHWCIRGDSKQCVCISTDTVTVVSIAAESQDVTCFRKDPEVEAVASVAVSQTLNGCFFLAHEGIRGLTVLYGGADEILQRETISLFPEKWDDNWDTGRCIPNIYAHRCSDVSLLAVVYLDAVSVTAWEGHSLVSTAVLKNELTIDFILAFWKTTARGARLFVLRSDSRCLMYDVVMRKGFLGIDEIIVAHQEALPSHLACLMGTVETGVFLCWPTATSHDCSIALLQCKAGEEKYEEIKVGEPLNHPADMESVLLVEVISIHGSHGVLCLFSTGECRLSLYNSQGTVLLAVEEHPYDVTSCLAFEGGAGGYYCVLGFKDGDIRVFHGKEMRASIHGVHCGAVDRLLTLPRMNEADETSFVSISTEMGTLCFHMETNASVSRIMCSPSKPLTACFFDRELEFVLLSSGDVANLWHIPTCLLERVLRSPQEQLNRRLVNILEPHWASPICTVRFRFAGRVYYAIRINVDSLVNGLYSAQESLRGLTPGYSLALGLLLRYLGEPCLPSFPRVDDLLVALGDLGLVVAGVTTHECVWSAIVLLCGLLGHTTDGHCAAEIYSLIEPLGEKLASSVAPDLGRVIDGLQCFFSRFFTLQRSTPTAIRQALQILVAKMPLSRLADVVKLLQSRGLSALSRLTLGSEVIGTQPLTHDNSLATLFAVLSSASQRRDYNLRSDSALYSSLRSQLVELQRIVTAALEDDESLSNCSPDLLGLVESYTILSLLDEKTLLNSFVKALLKRAFDVKRGESSQVTLEALQRLVGQDPQALLCNYIVEDFHLNVAYQPYIIVFLAHFVKNFPYEAYTVFSTIADIFVSGLVKLSSSKKDMASIYHAAVTQLLRVANMYLPNVSLQQCLRHLAVGRKDGRVMVYSMESASILTSFAAHSTPVWGVAYSGNISTLDIATVSEALDEIKVWRSPNQLSAFATFFHGGGATSFTLVTSMKLPSTDLGPESMSLLIKLFQLNWLSPQCVEFSSPWHGKVLVSLP